MTIYDKGLLRAMKQAYKNDGYDVAVSENRITIQTDSWGIEIYMDAVPNSVKSLIVLHNGGLPDVNSAVHVSKSECCGAIYGRKWFGQMFVRVQHIPHEDKPLMEHLSQMQWVPVELGE